MPGYGWSFGMGDGTANVGFGLLDTRRGTGADAARRAARAGWTRCPAEWELDEEHAVTPLRGAGLPMALHRQPAYTRGLLLAGDSAGVVNPFNGEGISYAMETGRMAAEAAVAALRRGRGPGPRGGAAPLPGPAARRVRPPPPARHGVPGPARPPDVVRFATAHGLKRPALVDRALRLMGNLTDGRDGDGVDRASPR